MSVPVLLITGFLGAGKTTLINRALWENHGLRIAAIVNDFGTINIDAELLSESADGVIGLKNGCICCSLQGDLLRTIKLLLNQSPVPDLIVIEASGVSDPAGIVQSLMDPVIWMQASLGNIVCVVDAPDAAARESDPLWQAQLKAADIVCLAKTDGMDPGRLADMKSRLAAQGKRQFFHMDDPLPLGALLDVGPQGFQYRDAGGVALRDDRFVTLEWGYDGAVNLKDFQVKIGQIAASLLRAKGILTFEGRAGPTLFQIAGQRATLAPAPNADRTGCALILIGERGIFDPDAAKASLDELAG